MIFAIAEQLAVFLPLLLGLYLAYSVMGITEFTLEGSFVLAASVYARCLSLGVAWEAACAFALLAAMLLGVISARVQERLQLDPMLTGIILTFIMVSINLTIMGRSNISLLGLERMDATPFIFASSSLAMVALGFAMHSRFGLLTRAFASNPRLLHELGKSPAAIRCCSLLVVNGLAGLSGIASCEANGFSDVHMGLGVVLIALTAIMLGEQLVRRLRRTETYSYIWDCFGLLTGGGLYFCALTGFIVLGIDPSLVKMAVGILLLVVLFVGKQTMTKEQL